MGQTRRSSDVGERGVHTSEAAGSTPAAATTRERKPDVDWERVERQFRTGAMSVREIAAEHKVSHTAVHKRAKREGWDRDLQARVQAKADAKVSKALVAAEVSPETKLSEQLVVEVEAEVQARVRLAQRADIGRARKLAATLVAELEHQTGNPDAYQQLHELLTDSEDGPSSSEAARRRLEVYQKAMSLSGRTKTMKDLADTLRTLVALEREAYGIDGQKGKADDPVEKAATSDEEFARRMAFVLARGVRAANDPIKPKAADAA